MPRFLQSKRQPLLEADHQSFVVTIRGDRFLYKMCRMIVGVLLSVGYGNNNLSLQDVQFALANGHWNTDTRMEDEDEGCVEEEEKGGSSARDDTNDNNDDTHHSTATATTAVATTAAIPVNHNIAGTLGKFQCAPAQGLALVQVEYPPHFKFEWVN
jgi:tRNA U38,U39,U40 pseudouridine synthase TruA